MDSRRFKICISYLVTATLISGLIFMMLSGDLESRRRIDQLECGMRDLEIVLLNAKPGNANPKGLGDMIEEILQRRLANIWDDIHSLKQRVRGQDCHSMGQASASEATLVVAEPRINYASIDLGAKIMKIKAVPLTSPSFMQWILGMDYTTNAPINMLQNSMDPGHCFAFKGVTAIITIKLARPINIEIVELEHIAPSMTPVGGNSSAPKAFSVFGIFGNRGEEKLLGNFVYNHKGTELKQQFNIGISAGGKYQLLRFKFESNHGNKDYTCIYRLAIYGIE